MNGPHDIGGHHGFGRIPYEPAEPVFHERWEARVFGMSLTLAGRRGPNLDAARHRGERLDPVAYFRNGYFGRWLAAFEMMLAEEGFLADGELDARLSGRATSGGTTAAPSPARGGPPLRGLSVLRALAATPVFGLGQAVVTRNHRPVGHTRLPAYARCRRGVVRRLHPAMVFPDTNAHGLGENPEYVYSVEFTGRELWGEEAEPGTSVQLDLFESYLAPAPVG